MTVPRDEVLVLLGLGLAFVLVDFGAEAGTVDAGSL